MSTAGNGLEKNHKVQFTDVTILKWEQPVTHRQYLERVVHLNKIKFIYKYDTHLELFFLFKGVEMLANFPNSSVREALVQFWAGRKLK